MKTTRKTGARAWQALLLLGLASATMAADDLAQQKAQLQSGINVLGRDVETLERNALLPAGTGTEVFFSVAPGTEFTPQSLTLFLDGKEMARHTYSKAEVKAVSHGGVHTLWKGNVAAGSHQLEGVLEGLDRKGKPVTNTARGEFSKGGNQHMLELSVSTSLETGEAVFTVKDRGDQ